MTEIRWKLLFITFGIIWFIVLYSTLSIYNNNILVDKEYDLTLLTLPLILINIFFMLTTIFIYLTFLFVFTKIKKIQQQIIDLNKKQNPISLDYYNSKALVTIIIPARNEASVIKRTINICLQQTYKNIEILVVCHNSSDATFDEANSISDKRVKCFDYKTKEIGKGVALNYGLKQASGQYILILDSDGILSKDFIEITLPLFWSSYKSKIAAVQGRFISSNRNYNLITSLLAMEDDLWGPPYMAVRSFFGQRCPLGGTGFIIRRDYLIDVGGFSNSLVDDYELTFKLLKNKYNIVYAPLSIVYDEKPPTLDVLFRQRARWFKGFLDLLNKRIVPSNDILGHISWISPIVAYSGLTILMILAFAAIHNLLFGFYPYVYAYMPINIWIALTVVLISLQIATFLIQKSSIKTIVKIPLYLIFSQYSLVIILKALFVKSWGSTKTVHGFIKASDLQLVTR